MTFSFALLVHNMQGGHAQDNTWQRQYVNSIYLSGGTATKELRKEVCISEHMSHITQYASVIHSHQ